MSPQPPRTSRYPQQPGAGSWREPSDADLLPRAPTGLVVVVAALVAAATVLGLHYIPKRVGGAGEGAGELQVPEVVGMTLAQARMAAESAGLTLQEMGAVNDPFVPEGKVAKQVPLAGQSAGPGANLVVTLSKGPEAVTIPALAGMEVPQAVERLIGVGLRVGKTQEQEKEGVPDGQVIGSVPAAGSPARPGDRIDLVVAHAPAQAPPPAARPSSPRPAPRTGGTVTVPKVVGIRLRYASGRLAALGLNVGRVTYLSDEDHMEGYILRQSPPPGAAVPRGSAIDLTVNQTN